MCFSKDYAKIFVFVCLAQKDDNKAVHLNIKFSTYRIFIVKLKKDQ